ncbi:MAG: hypothetical protein HXY28_01300 [Hydrogenophilaceae bacterium]|jgi:hypothetical protein|nr:hypothetical protein [Hydrogenophilaceae bacterium]
MMKAIAAACAAVAVSAAAACSQAGAQYPAAVRQNFMAGCTQTGAPEAICACSLRNIEKEFSFQQFTEWENAMKVGAPHDMTARVQTISLSCATNPAL